MVDMRKSGLTGTSDSGAYSDLNRLNSLKVGNRDSAGNIRKVAQEFESLFVGEMLKSARAATDVMAQDNPLNTPATKQYQEMYDHQLAVTMSRQGGGIGLADVLVRQMTKNKPTRPADGGLKVGPPAVRWRPKRQCRHRSVPAPPRRRPRFTVRALQWPAAAMGLAVASPIHNSDGSLRNDMAKLNERRLSLPSKLTDRLVAGLVPSADGSLATVNTQAVPARNSAASDSVLQGQAARSLSGVSTTSMRIYGRAVAQPPLAPAKRAFSSPDEFVATMLPMAEQAARRIGVDPRYLVAQAALETGWGKSVMRQQDGSSSHNLFGIKAAAVGRAAGPRHHQRVQKWPDGQGDGGLPFLCLLPGQLPRPGDHAAKQ
ncbi:rod-binding protein [Pseudomonas sp. PCH446]